jgi:hypothetical protein
LADIELGRIVSNDRQTVYVAGSHWASISYEVCDAEEHLWLLFNELTISLIPQLADIRDHFDQETQTEPANILDSGNANGPLILDASDTPPDLESILSDVPPKDITSKLVSRYFNGVEFPNGKSFAAGVTNYGADIDCSDCTYANV